MTETIWLNSDHGSNTVYVTVAEVVAALQKMPQDAKVLITVNGRDSDETKIPTSVRVTKFDDYYLEDEGVVQIYAF